MFAPKTVVSAVFGAIWPSGPSLFHPRLETLHGVAWRWRARQKSANFPACNTVFSADLFAAPAADLWLVRKSRGAIHPESDSPFCDSLYNTTFFPHLRKARDNG